MAKKNLSLLTRALVRLGIEKKNAEDAYKGALDEAIAAVPENSTYVNSKGAECTGYKDANGLLYKVHKDGKLAVDEELLDKIGTQQERAAYAKLLAKYPKELKGSDYWAFKADTGAVVAVTIEMSREAREAQT